MAHRDADRTLIRADDPVRDDRQRLLVRLVDKLHDAAEVTDDLWYSLARTWSAEQLVELITVCGMYHAVSSNAARMELEPDADRFPGRTIC